MFVVLIGTVVTFAESVAHPGIFAWSVTAWLALTVLFANFAEAVAEGRGKAQADTLRKMRSDTEARRLRPDGTRSASPPPRWSRVTSWSVSPATSSPPTERSPRALASVDESAITGESAPVIRESGGDRSAVTGGPRCSRTGSSVRITAERGHTFLDRMIALVEGAERQKTPNEVALTILLAALTIIFVPVVVVWSPSRASPGATVSVIVLVALLVCLIPTTIGALLSAIGIAGMDRLVQRNVLAMSGRAVEAAGDVQTLLLDKTGTITLGNRMASAFYPVDGHTEEELASAAQLASLADETPEGRSIVVLAKEKLQWHPRARARSGARLRALHRADPHVRAGRRRAADPQGRGRRGAPVGGRAGRHRQPSSTASSSGRPVRLDAAGRRRWPSACSA
jgi:K+-transporting ATPase ATPase B chain